MGDRLSLRREFGRFLRFLISELRPRGRLLTPFNLISVPLIVVMDWPTRTFLKIFFKISHPAEEREISGNIPCLGTGGLRRHAHTSEARIHRGWSCYTCACVGQ